MHFIFLFEVPFNYVPLIFIEHVAWLKFAFLQISCIILQE